MSLKNVNTVLAAAVVLFSLYLGLSFVLTPETSAPGFGLPDWPSGDGGGFLIVKGCREIAMGLAMGILLLTGHRRALGLVLLMVAIAPLGDMTTVLAHHGSMATAFGIHGLTSALIAATGLLILRETGKVRKTQEAAAPAPVAQPA
ncbi:DUF4267 domain-containing protein [Actinomadura darangshiensis]|uniref:DUF4267 domain-containing protein n=1 Tax=Actinomadura darangshiensis TaxID=705336 RepID=A0A4R5BLE5_9ACTN|nr:DUF4267 domain-containing protein [Actinomadura darangshiensis]TDD86685.1 DUF4267 domain-containing protein [Actinomadura darangshiensis]